MAWGLFLCTVFFPCFKNSSINFVDCEYTSCYCQTIGTPWECECMWLDLLIGLESTNSDFQSQRFEWNASVLRMRSLFNMGLAYFRGLVLWEGRAVTGISCCVLVARCRPFTPCHLPSCALSGSEISVVPSEHGYFPDLVFLGSSPNSATGSKFSTQLCSLPVNFKAPGMAGWMLTYVYCVGGPTETNRSSGR